MSDDEKLIAFVSGFGTLALWTAWYVATARTNARVWPAGARRLLRWTPLLCAAVLYAVLRTLASWDVQDDMRYVVMYLLMGMVWVGATVHATAFLGLSLRDDVTERGNAAAAPALGGAMLGATFAFAGGNIGDGPGWWVVVFAAALATSALAATWSALDAATSVNDAVTIDRDLASGVRLGGFLAAAGLIYGRAAAGDWVTLSDTVREFLVVGSPAMLLLGLAFLVERAFRPSPARPEGVVTRHGVLPAVSYLLAAAAYLTVVGTGA